VVSIISEAFVEAANYTSIDAPPGVSEWDLSGLTREPSQLVKPPRVKESAFSMECVLDHYYDMKVPTQFEMTGRRWDTR
jgi:flavin reductase (DIM6/NTAB) family NADH-FMN oxidoreductase RutF